MCPNWTRVTALPVPEFPGRAFLLRAGEALGHEDGADEAEVAVGVVPDGFVGVGAVAVQGEEIGVADVILADLLDEKAAVEPEGADLTVAGRALHAEGDAAVGEIRLHGVAVDADGELGVRVGRGVVLYKKIAGRLRRAGANEAPSRGMMREGAADGSSGARYSVCEPRKRP